MKDETPRVGVRLHLRNVAQEPGPIRLLWSPGRYFFMPMTFRVVDATGKDVRRGGGLIEGMAELHHADLVVPHGESISLWLSGNSLYASVYSVASIDLGQGGCFSQMKEDGPCSLLSALEIAAGKEGDSPQGQWHGRIELPPVPIPVRGFRLPLADFYNPSVAAPLGLMILVVFIGWLVKRRSGQRGHIR